MKNNFKCGIQENGVAIQSGDEKFILSFEAISRSWPKAKAFAEERDGDLPTIGQGQILSKYALEINERLREAGKPQLTTSCWLNSEQPGRPTHGMYLDVSTGFTMPMAKASSHSARVILPFTGNLK